MTETKTKLRVLLVEDNLSDVQIFKQMMDRLGYKSEIHDFSSGEKALTYLNENPENPPHLVIVDLELPGMHGLEFLKTLKANPAWKEIPVIVNTSSTSHDDISKTYRYGATFFMQKLYDIQLLGEAISHLKITGRLKN